MSLSGALTPLIDKANGYSDYCPLKYYRHYHFSFITLWNSASSDFDPFVLYPLYLIVVTRSSCHIPFRVLLCIWARGVSDRNRT